MVDLLQLRYFQAVAHHQHVSRAAAELHVAQPALSRSIARLETELGVPLFDRHGRRVQLNRFGTMFLARVARAIGELDQGQHELHAVPASPRLARRTHVEAGMLAGERFVTTRPGYWQRSLTDQLFAGSGIKPTIACEGDEPYAIRGLISAGAGIGLMPAVARRLA